MVEGMRTVWVIGIIFLVCALVSTVSAYGPVHFSYSGDLVVTYVSQTAGYNNEFGIETPDHFSLGYTGGIFPQSREQHTKKLAGVSLMNRLSCISRALLKVVRSPIIPTRAAGTDSTMRW